MAVVLGTLIVPSLTLVVVEGTWRSRWVVASHVERDLGVLGAGAFREGNVRGAVATTERDRAPASLRFMAFVCWFFGQMIVPGFLLWCLGLLILADEPGAFSRRGDPAGLALMASFIPGAWSAVLLWSAGCALLRGERDRADRATLRAVLLVGGYNALALLASLVWLRLHPRDGYLWGTAAYCALSLVQVLALRWSYVRHRDEFPAAEA